MHALGTIAEPAMATAVVCESDLCVVGGSCTGVFAAVRAARLGLTVALVEQNVILGGTATAAQVNEWHSTLDANHENVIIGGLTQEVITRLRRRNAVQDVVPIQRGQFRFNSAELAVELDELVREHKIRVFLGARCVAAVREGELVRAVIIEDKSGRRAIRSHVFIDASGDGDLLRRAGFKAYQHSKLQPVNLQALVTGLDKVKSTEIWKDVRHLAEEFDYPLATSTPWFFNYPGAEHLVNIFGARLNGIDASDADQLTQAYSEARRLHRAFLDMVQAEFGVRANVAAWSHAMGVRDTWHARCRHQLTGQELLEGRDFADAIGNGTYPVDIHHPEGTILRYIDGREEIVARDGSHAFGRWKPEGEATPSCYHIPYSCLVPVDAGNLLVAGRLLDADREGFAGVRVMVNCNQTGEAAGVAAALAVQRGVSVGDVDVVELREALAQGGSIVLGQDEVAVLASSRQ